ncbi:hypothetical protein ACFP8W_15790, partial [Nocardioides hankookensis]
AVPGLPLSQPSGAPSIPILGDLLGLGRAPVGATRSRGPTMGQLSRAFDPALVQLLVPGMVSTR